MPQQSGTPKNLDELLDRLEGAAKEEERLSLDRILDAVGRRSFGPIILLAGIITLMPVVGDIPGVPTMMGILVVLSAGQMLFRRNRIWMPKWLLNRSADSGKLCKAVGWFRKPARFIDRLIRHRLPALVRGVGASIIALACVLIGLAMPAMEIVPFSANGAGVALTAFGLALIADDGLLATIALVFTVGTFGFVGYHLIY